MGITVACVRVAATVSTAPYTQDVTTTDLGGLTPKAAIIIGSRAITDATAVAHNVVSYGACTGATNEWVVAASDEDAVADSDNDCFFDDDFCVLFVNPGDQTVDGSAEFSAFIANGLTINWTDAPAGAYFLTVIFFAGTDLSAYAASFTHTAALDVAEAITAPGFRPTDVLLAYTTGVSTTDGNNTQYMLSLGLVHDAAGTVTMRSLTWGHQVTAAAGQDNSQFRTDYCLGNVQPSDGALIRAYDASAFGANGFSLTKRIFGGDRGIGYLALAFGGVVSSWVGTVTTPTATGNRADTGPGFKPQAVVMLMGGAEVAATAYTDGRGGIGGVSAITATAQQSVAWASEDAAATMNTQSLADDQAVNLPDHAGAALIAATYVSLDATGFTLNYSAVSATAKLWPALVIGAVSAQSVVPILMRQYRQRRI